ncbi:hypothetical protein QY97_01662 [Bacillus thermotolerans]|nr:hypothetical protein QY97_01662 [Bacillus thermotolerans]KKB44994.1 hypothetical protein QY96_00118 [Bacillus thermotolerans]
MFTKSTNSESILHIRAKSVERNASYKQGKGGTIGLENDGTT